MDVEALKQRLIDEAHLSPDQAEKAAQVAINFMSEHMPGTSGMLDKAGGSEGIAKKIGGLFHRS